MKTDSRIAIIHPIIKPPISPPVNKSVWGVGLAEVIVSTGMEVTVNVISPPVNTSVRGVGLADVVVSTGMEVTVSTIKQSGANKLSSAVAQRGSTWNLNESTKIEAFLV